MAVNYLYNRDAARDYAQNYALTRNPKYFNFDEYGGDCTNFVSQCLYAGSGYMSALLEPKWFYISPQSRAPSWSGVEFLRSYLKSNSLGVYGQAAEVKNLQIGDVIFLRFSGVNHFGHSLIVSKTESVINSYSDIYVCAHTIDSLNRPLSAYRFVEMDCVHILGVKKPA